MALTRKEQRARRRYKRQTTGERMVITTVGGSMYNALGQIYVRELGGLDSGGVSINTVPKAITVKNAGLYAGVGRVVIVKEDYDGRLYIAENDERDLIAAGINLRQLNHLDQSTRFKTLSLITDFNSFPTGGDGTVRVMPGFYRQTDGTLGRFAGQTSIDLLTSYTPATTDNQHVVCLWLDVDTNTLSITTSSEISQATDLKLDGNLSTGMTLINEAALSAPPRHVGIWSYIIKGDDTVVDETNKYIDLRPFFDAFNTSGNVGYPNPVTYDFIIPDGNTLIVEDGWTISAGGSVTLGAGSVLSVVDHNPQLSVVEYTTTSTMTRNDDMVRMDCSGGGFTLSLPSIATAYNQVYRLKLVNDSGGVSTLSPDGSDTIEDASSYVYSVAGESLTLMPDKTNNNWMIV